MRIITETKVIQKHCPMLIKIAEPYTPNNELYVNKLLSRLCKVREGKICDFIDIA